MAKLTRYTQKQFAGSAAANRISEFGSLAAGAPLTYSGSTITPAIIQTLTNYLQGWDGAVIGTNSPAIQDMNALQYLFSYQLGYLLQEGVAEYDAATPYFIGSVVNNGFGVLYSSLIDNNLGNALTVQTAWAPVQTSDINWLFNSGFDFSQRSGALGTTTISYPNNPYVVDRWSVLNDSPGSTVSAVQVAGVLPQSKYGLQVTFTGAGTSGEFELHQVLENTDSLNFYNQYASFGVNVKAVGNVNQVALQFLYNTSENRATGGIGSPTFVSVSTGGFTLCEAVNQAIGSAMTTAGIIGVSIYPSGVSGNGHVYDSGNGIIVEQAQLKLNSQLGVWSRQGATIGEELALCQRYYEKSCDIATAPFVGLYPGSIAYIAPTSGQNTTVGVTSVAYSVTKRIAATAVVYSPATGIINKWYNVDAGGDQVAGAVVNGTHGFSSNTALTDGDLYIYHFAVDADI